MKKNNARAIAHVIVMRMPRRKMSFGKLHLMMYFTQCAAVRAMGSEAFSEAVVARRDGPRVATIDRDFYRWARIKKRTTKRRLRALEEGHAMGEKV